jgi:asparagine synthase (glutamine-hydrolysing)
MCGIVGILRADGAPVSGSLLDEMRDSLVHRGPDDAGTYLKGPVGLGARRLSVLDPTPSGHQPMGNHDGTLWIVFNGEIYNYVELAQELRSLGHRLVSQSDTEVLLHLYEQFGKECLHRLNGMFGFAIWDTKERTLFAARDRLGIKPFYYHQSGQRFLFASEVKALLQADPSLRRPDNQALADYLFSGGPLGGKTGFAGISELPPGHWLTWHNGHLSTRRYWDLAYRYEDPKREAELVAELAWVVNDAVRIHSRSDVPLGCHLSGGLDSSAVASHAARHVRPLTTFSVRFSDGPYYDESEHARVVAAHIGATHVEDVGQPRDLGGLLPALIYHMDFGLPAEGAFGYFAVSRLARRHVKVALTGHGGDEVFVGYPKYFDIAFGSTAMFDLSGRPIEGPSVMGRMRTVLRREGPFGLVQRLGLRLQPRPSSLEDRWISYCGPEPARNPMLHPRFVQTLGGYSPRGACLRPFHEASTDEILDKCLYNDLRVYLPLFLALEDRMSMAVSLESRVPLLDHRVVELMGRIPPSVKVNGLQPKRLLKEIVRPLLPESIRNRRDKRPFPIPHGRWFAGELAGIVQDILRSPSCLDRGIFHPDRLREGNLSANTIWPIINLELWFRIFVDRDPYWVEQALTLTTLPSLKGGHTSMPPDQSGHATR